MMKKRGRPPGPRQADRKRNLFVYLLVVDFMDIGLRRKDAVEVAAGLLTHDRNEFDRRFTRRLVGTALEPRTRLWKKDQEQVDVDVADGPITLPMGAMVWMAWEQAWQRRADFDVADAGLFLSAARVGRIYDDLTAEYAPCDSVTCPECGHPNLHSPARGQLFWLGHSCRACGAGTGDVPSDPDPAPHR